MHRANEPLGQTRALEHLLDPLADQRRERGGLEDHSVACHQRNRHLTKWNRPRIVPGGDHADDSDRLVAEETLLLLQDQLGVLDLLVGEDLGAVVRAPVQEVDRGHDLHRVGLDPGLALLTRQELCDLVGVVD